MVKISHEPASVIDSRALESPDPQAVRAIEPGALSARGVTHRFGDRAVLRGVSLAVPQGTIHAVLGPNGAGKTTLVRILAGLLQPQEGTVTIDGIPLETTTREVRQRIGFIPSGDRSFYLRISGLENLIFFGRLHGFRRSEAKRRALALLGDVGLADAAGQRAGKYSHGMQKRLGIARALLASPPILLVDEATHDLDPEGARRVRGLVADRANQGASVVWVTQRLDEIRGFADTVTVLGRGEVQFAGTVPELMAHARPRRFLLHLGGGIELRSTAALRALVVDEGTIDAVSDSEHYVLVLSPSAVLGNVLARLTREGIAVLSCNEEQSEIEEAFLLLTRNLQE